MDFKGKKEQSTDIINTLPIPVLLIDSYGKIVDYNDAFSNVFGLNKLKGKHLKEVKELSTLWSSVLYCKTSSEPIKDRISFNDKEFEIVLKTTTLTYLQTLISIAFYDITHFMNIERELLKRNQELMIINTLSTTFINSENIAEVFNELLEKVLMLTEFKVGMILLRENDQFRIVAESGVSKEFSKRTKEGELNSFFWHLFEEGQPLYIAEEDEIKNNPLLIREGIEFLVISPLVVSEKIFGVLLLASRRPISFDFDLASLISLVANHSSLIIEKVKLFEETQRLSITDSLTGLYNARHFYRSLHAELERAKRYNDAFSLVIFDIDDFKQVNDTYGHQIGDDLLKEFADILFHFSRKSDIVARYGGEEFVMILPKTPKESAYFLANRILKKVQEHKFLADKKLSLNISISGGISTFPEDGDNEKDLLYCADMALYKAKQEGKKRVICFNKTIFSEVSNETGF